MLKDGVVVMVICLIALGGLAVWWTQTPSHLNAAVPQVLEPAPAPAHTPVVKKASKPQAPPPIVERSAAVAAEASPAPAVQLVPPPFPAVEQIATGAHVDAITDKYGDPVLSAVTSSGGHMVETFVYARNRGQNATVIRLQDGKVATAYSQAAPTVPPGLSAPRRFHVQ
jgi:hypothetical protein